MPALEDVGATSRVFILSYVCFPDHGYSSQPSRFWHATLCRKDSRRINRYWWATGLGGRQPGSMARYDAREPTRHFHLLLTFCHPVIDAFCERSEKRRR